MITRPFGKTGINVPAVGLGTWNIGGQWGEVSDLESDAIIRTAIASGMRLIDTAESYGIPNGTSELRISRVLHEFDREELVLVSKIGHWGKRTGQEVPKTTADLIRLCGHAIAGRLKTDYVDTILCHDGGIQDPTIYIEGFEKLVEDGFLRNYGISTNSLEVLKTFQDISGGKCAVVELEYSLLNRSTEEDIIPYCQQEGIGILVRGPLRKGILSGRYDLKSVFTDSVRSSWNRDGEKRGEYEELIRQFEDIRQVIGEADLIETALRFIITHPANMVVIPGATTTSQVESNAAAGADRLDPDLYEKLLDLKF